MAPRVGYPKGISSTTSWYSGHPNHDLSASQGVSSRNLICGYKKRYIAIAIYLFYGSSCWARTNDLSVNSRALYQLS